MTEDKEYELRREEIYLTTRKSSEEKKFESEASFDKALLTLSAAILGFSITFLKENILSGINCKTAIYLSWISFFATILASLFSHKTATKAFKLQMEQIDEMYEGKSNKIGKNKYDKQTTILNNIGGTSFVFGITLLLIFLYINFINK